MLERRWQQAKSGEGCVVLISGEPGIGKSRLAQTLIDRLAGEPYTRLRTFCSPHHQDHALYPTITQLERAAGFRREDTTEHRLDKLEAVLALATNDLGEAAPLFAALLSLPIGERYPPLNLTPQRQKEKTLRALVAQVEGLAARQPVLMLFEDAHWSDPTSLELFDLTIDRVPAMPVLLIVTYRPEFTAPWIGRPHVTSLGLNRLAPRQRAEMIAGITGGKALPGEIADQIIDRTDGVPLFVEELTKAVVESGLLTDAGDHYTAAEPLPALAIPASLQASLLARLDRLAPVREVAQIGAALGRQFSHELIGAVAALPQPRLDDALAQLVGAELIYRRGTPPDAEYTFKHALVQEPAYGTLLRSRRQQLHARIAATLEGQFPEIVAAQPALLAHHCTEAGQNEKAVGYLLKAGRQAVARAVMTEAVAQLQRGLDLLGTLPDSPRRQQQELDLQVALGPALFATRGYGASDVGRTLARGLALVEQLDQPDYLAPLLYGQWVFHNARADYKLALSFAEQLEQVGEARNDDAARLLGRFVQGHTRLQLGEITAARALCEQSDGMSNPAHRAVYAAVTAEDPHVVMTGSLAWALTILGYVDQGRAKIDEALAEARRLDNASTLALTLFFACEVAISVASPREALRHAKEMEALSRVHNLPLYLARGSVYCGWSLTILGQTRDGPAMLTKGLSDLRATGAVNTSRALVMLAETHAKLGRPDEGLNCLTEAATIIEMTDGRLIEPALHWSRGEVLNATGDEGAAEQSYCQALAVARRQEAKLSELRAATSLARLWRDQGKRAEARDLLAPVYGWFTEGLGTPVLQEAKALLEELGDAPALPVSQGSTAADAATAGG